MKVCDAEEWRETFKAEQQRYQITDASPLNSGAAQTSAQPKSSGWRGFNPSQAGVRDQSGPPELKAL